MARHNLIQKYFHGCGDCRNCCNGKMFSMGRVTFSDIKNIVKLFPTVFDLDKKEFLYFYSLSPSVECHYFRDENCSIYNILDRPDTCKNFPFGIYNQVIHADYKACPQLNDKVNDFPILNVDGTINPKVMNDFFSEFQYISNLNNSNVILDDFVEIVFNSNSLKSIPIFKTHDGESIDITEIDANKHLRILDIEKINKIIRKMDNMTYESFIHCHLLSLQNLPLFGKRLVELCTH